MKYTAKIPYIDDMGSVSPVCGVYDKPSESKEEEVLWYLNRMREHDGLKPLKHLPVGVVFIPVTK